MTLWELPAGSHAKLLVVPCALLPLGITPQKQIQAVCKPKGLVVLDIEGARFALSQDLSQQIIVSHIKDERI